MERAEEEEAVVVAGHRDEPAPGVAQRLEVTHLARNSDGRITEFDGSVEHHCERSQDKTFTAEIHYVLGDS